MNFRKIARENIISIIIYFVLLCFFTFLVMNNYTCSNMGFLMSVFILVLVLGIILIFYFRGNMKNLYKVAFVVIIIFGLCSVFITPLCDISDEYEHLTRSEIVSGGEITADYVKNPENNASGYKTIMTIKHVGDASDSNLFAHNLWDTDINYTDYYSPSAFAQNPFYAYLAPALGIILAELLNLSSVWTLFLGRIANLLLYAVIVSIAIRKAPAFKFPLFIISIFPLAIFQAASVSSDCFFICFAILAVAYFFVLYKSDNIRYKDLGIFFGSIILLSFLKQPYVALSFLIFAVPRSNFKDRRQGIISLLGVVFAFAIVGLWTTYAAPLLQNSWRGVHFINNHVDPNEQVKFMLSNPSFTLYYLYGVLTSTPIVSDRLFEFSAFEHTYRGPFFSAIYAIFILIVSLFYPFKEKFSIFNRLKVLIIGALIYYGIFIVQYWTWIPVRSLNFADGVNGRYFIPLLMFIPLIINISSKTNFNKKIFSNIAFAVAISFIGGILILTTVAKF